MGSHETLKLWMENTSSPWQPIKWSQAANQEVAMNTRESKVCYHNSVAQQWQGSYGGSFVLSNKNSKQQK